MKRKNTSASAAACSTPLPPLPPPPSLGDLVGAACSGSGGILLSSNQRRVLEEVVAGRNVFVTGRAGCGKSAVVTRLIAMMDEGNVPFSVAASTGIAAVPFKDRGTTFHALFGLGAQDSETDTVDACVKRVLRNRNRAEEVRTMKVLIVDEVSMISEGVMQQALGVMRKLRGGTLPQLVLVGDFLQLPPVKGQLLLNSPTWLGLDLTTVYLANSFRQQDGSAFMRLLDEARFGSLSDESETALQERVNAKLALPAGVEPTKLLSRRASVDAINKTRLEALKGRAVTYHGCVFVGARYAPDDDDDDEVVSAATTTHAKPVAATGDVSAGATDEVEDDVVVGAEDEDEDGDGGSGRSGDDDDVLDVAASGCRLKFYLTPAKGEWAVEAANLTMRHPVSDWVVSPGTTSTMPRGHTRPAAFVGADICLPASRDAWIDAEKHVNNCNVTPVLKLAIGAQVMFCANFQPPTVMNGTQGVVVAFQARTHLPIVRLYCGKHILVTPRVVSKRLNPKEKMPCVGLVQLPLRHSWALTIHKAQGQTLKFAEIDLGPSIFEASQAYVALSRVQSLETLTLTDFSVRSIRSVQAIVKYYKDLEAAQHADVDDADVVVGDEDDDGEPPAKKSTPPTTTDAPEGPT